MAARSWGVRGWRVRKSSGGGGRVRSSMLKRA
jgi:hypothetical protein